MKEKRSLSRTLLETKTPEEIIAEHGRDGFLVVLFKSFNRHDSDRHRRRLERTAKYRNRKTDY